MTAPSANGHNGHADPDPAPAARRRRAATWSKQRPILASAESPYERAVCTAARSAGLTVKPPKARPPRDLMESVFGMDWVSPYMDLFDRLRTDPVLTGPAAAWNRKWGRNYPLYQSEQELALLRAPARIMCGTNVYAIGMQNTVVNYVVGTGFTYLAAPKKGGPENADVIADAVQVLIDEFIERTEWQGGEVSSMEREFVQRSREDGEAILLHWLGDDGTVDVRTVEPEQLTAAPGGDPAEWLFGIHTPGDDVQKILGYWIYFGDSPSEGCEYGPDVVTHFRCNAKRSIKRGLSDYTFSTYDALSLADKLRTNLGDTAAQQAAIVYVMQHETGTRAEVQQFADDKADYTQRVPLSQSRPEEGVEMKRRGREEHIPKGQVYVAPPTASNQPIHLEVLQGLCRAGGRRWSMTESMISGDASNNNMASQLISNDPFVIAIRAAQHVYGQTFKRTMWLVVRHHIDTHGRLVAGGRGYTYEQVKAAVEIQVEGPNPEVRDRMADAQRRQIERQNGVLSPQSWATEEGYDAEQEQRQIDEWNDRNASAGAAPELDLPGDTGGMPQDPFDGTETVSESRLLAALFGGRVLLEDTAGLVQKTITVHGKTGPYQRKVWVAPKEAPKVKPTQAAEPDKAKFVGATVGAAVHAHAESVKHRIAKFVGGIPEEETSDAGQKDKKPYDVKIVSKDGDSDIEVKSMSVGGKQAISVHDDALARKVQHIAKNPKNTFHTVVVDDRATYGGGANKGNYSGHPLYYKRGSGRYALSKMYKVKDAEELKRLIGLSDDQLPEAARGALPPPPPIDDLLASAARAAESRKVRDKARKEKNRDVLRAQAQARAAKAKAAKG